MQIDRDDASAGQINSIDSFDPFFLVASFLCNLNSSHQRSGQPKSASAILHDLLLCDTSRFGGRRCRFAINLCRKVLLKFRQFLIKYTGSPILECARPACHRRRQSHRRFRVSIPGLILSQKCRNPVCRTASLRSHSKRQSTAIYRMWSNASLTAPSSGRHSCLSKSD